MATTSIWSVKGWLGKVVVYIENPDKTENPQFFEKQEITKKQSQGLSDVIDYAVNNEKTAGAADESYAIMQSFVSGVNCHPNTARDEMMAVKRRFGKDGGVMAYHGYQSFAPGEATPELAHQIGVRLAEKLWGEKYQVLIATHLDKGNHLHNHFVVNTVSYLDGIRYHRTEKDYYNMQVESDRLCHEYGLSVIDSPKRGKGKHYGEWRAEQEQRPTWRGLIREDVDAAIQESATERQFFDNLKKEGYEIKVGKDISVRPQGKDRFVRLARNFGDEYTMESICRRILSEGRMGFPMSVPPPKVRKYKTNNNLRTARKLTGFRALYFQYCYKLGILPKGRPTNNKRLHFLLREDLRKMEAISKEARLLCEHRIDTAEQLSLYKSSLTEQVNVLVAKRRQLYKFSRTNDIKADTAKLLETRVQISALSKQLSALRKEVVLCDDIALRSGVMLEKLRAVREDEKLAGKEKTKDELIR